MGETVQNLMSQLRHRIVNSRVCITDVSLKPYDWTELCSHSSCSWATKWLPCPMSHLAPVMMLTEGSMARCSTGCRSVIFRHIYR